jgi:hypothetical protein
MKLFLILIFGFSLNTYAQKDDPLIPFVITKTVVKDSKGKYVNEAMNGWVVAGHHFYGQAGNIQYSLSQSQDTKYIKSSTISKIVSNVKRSLCSAIEKGEFKVWLKVDGSGKVLGIGVSAEGGIEVTVKCGV